MNPSKIFEKLTNYLTNNDYRFKINAHFGFYNRMNDEEFIKRIYKATMGKELNLDNPLAYNEKLQWLKLNDRNPLYTTLADKYEAKKYVTEKIGAEYLIPTIGVWNSFDEIDFDKLPNRFVLKCTHDSGGLVICKDKSTLDFKKAKKILNGSLRKNYYLQFREWPYKDVTPRIIAEPYMEDTVTGALNDYKFFVFNGHMKILHIVTERHSESTETRFDFFDRNFSHLPFSKSHRANADIIPQEPKTFKKMITLAEKLSADIPHVRVDFYEVDGKIYFGEFTFFPAAGFGPFDPEEWDYTLGSWIDLPQIKQ